MAKGVDSPTLYNAEADGYVFKKLPKKVKDAWVKALESGEYMQGQDQLGHRPSSRHKKRYCCLGVGCEVIPSMQKLSRWKDEDAGGRLELVIGDNHSDWTGFQKFAGLDLTAHGVLVELNDSGASFQYIANWIKENL